MEKAASVLILKYSEHIANLWKVVQIERFSWKESAEVWSSFWLLQTFSNESKKFHHHGRPIFNAIT